MAFFFVPSLSLSFLLFCVFGLARSSFAVYPTRLQYLLGQKLVCSLGWAGRTGSSGFGCPSPAVAASHGRVESEKREMSQDKVPFVRESEGFLECYCFFCRSKHVCLSLSIPNR